jgi:hypothetical protein
MQLEELQQKWQRLDEKLDQSLAIQTELLRQSGVRPVRRRIRQFAVWPAIDLAFGAGVALFAGSVLGDHWRDGQLAAPALVLLGSAVALAISSVLQLRHVAELDWCGPIAEIQSALQRLQTLKIRQFKWIILCSPLVGFCALMVALQWPFAEGYVPRRIHIMDRVDPWWVLGNYAFGILFVPVGYFVARFLSQRYQRQQWWRAAVQDISGNSLKSAVRDCEHWASLLGPKNGSRAAV